MKISLFKNEIHDLKSETSIWLRTFSLQTCNLYVVIKTFYLCNWCNSSLLILPRNHETDTTWLTTAQIFSFFVYFVVIWEESLIYFAISTKICDFSADFQLVKKAYIIKLLSLSPYLCSALKNQLTFQLPVWVKTTEIWRYEESW